MEKLIINTGLKSFVMPDKISQISKDSIVALKSFDMENFNLATKIETLAQICAMHTRFNTDFKSHAFLLKIDEFTDNSDETTYGDYKIVAKTQGSVKSAFSYSISAECNKKEIFFASIIIATTDYSEAFQKEQLSKHYRKIYSCLTKDLQKN